MNKFQQEIARCNDLLTGAQCVLVAAGSGLSVAAGINYTDTAYFAEHFPKMVSRGFRMQAELMGYSAWHSKLKWGYLAANVYEVRFNIGLHPIYQRLLGLMKDKNYFVHTSNVDGMFEKNGFEKDRIFTPQGDYARMQCQTPCTTTTWVSRPILERILPEIDPETQEVVNTEVLPRCPNCGGDVMLNVRGGDWFVGEPYVDQAEKLRKWIESTYAKRLLVIEIGAGFNTPMVIRWPDEHIVLKHPNANLIRIDLTDPSVPNEILNKSVTIKNDAITVISALHEQR